jgi:predicted enzyme related to lactoylglutathione lyase
LSAFRVAAHQRDDDRIIELRPASAGATILLHPAGKGHKQGQSVVKLVFDVEDVERFCGDAKKRGLVFGPVHRAHGYFFANAKDPSGNPVSVSSRAYAT